VRPRSADLLRIIAVFLIFCSGTGALTDDTASTEAWLRQALVGKVLTLRQFCSEPGISYHAAGQPSPCTSCPWTLCSKVEIQSLKLKRDQVHLIGDRLFVHFNDQPNLASQMSLAKTGRLVELAIDVNPADRSAINGALKRVFLKPGESLTDYVPDFWKPFFTPKAPNGTPHATNTNPLAGATTSSSPVKMSPGVAQGKLIHEVKPEYPAFAKAYHAQGTVVLDAVIGKDGTIHNLYIKKPAGMGLDEEAFEAVRQWRYRPYTVQGEPVEVETEITANFTLSR
jgi:TonB family protein